MSDTEETTTTPDAVPYDRASLPTTALDLAVAALNGPTGSWTRALLGTVVVSEGLANVPVTGDKLGEATGLKPSTAAIYMAELAQDGWLRRTPIVSASGRPVFQYETTQAVR